MQCLDYTILRVIAPLDLLVKDGIATLDKILHVCCALTICPSVVPLD